MKNKISRIFFIIILAFFLAFEFYHGINELRWFNVQNGFNTLELQNGVYKGNISLKNFSGAGEYVLDIGTSYDGTWLNSSPNGQGVLKIDSLGTYEGGFENGERNGEGTFTWINGNYVEGTWSLDKLYGDFTLNKGKWSFLCSVGEEDEYMLNGLLYSDDDYTISWDFDIKLDEFNEDILSKTKAILVTNDGAKITGLISNGNFNGDCTVNYANGDIYKGNLSNGARSGYGEYKWNSNDIKDSYCGDWSNDMMNGEGTYYYKGSKSNYLKGEFLNNYPNGECICEMSGSEIYGTWKTIWKNGRCVSIEMQ